MAYVDESPLEDEDLKDDDGGVQTSGAPLSTSGSPATPGGAAASAKSKTPGRFADLSEYLRVNAPQEFGTKLAGKVGDDITAGENTLQNAQTEFKSRADANIIRDDQGLSGQVAQNPEGIDVDAFTKLRDAQYKGPTSLADAADLNSQVTGAAGSAVGKANASKTEGGRFALLDNYFGKPSYSSGQKSLDNLLVQNDPKSQQAFDQMRQNAQTLQSSVNQAGVDLGSYGATAKGTTEATRAGARGAVGIDDAGNAIDGGYYANQRGDLDANAKAYQSQVQRAQDLIGQRKFSELSPEVQAQLASIGQTYGADPSKYFSINNDSISAASLASPEQLTRMRALSKLAGQDGSAYDAADAGTEYGKDAYSFDNAALANTANLRKQEFTSKKAVLDSQLQSASGAQRDAIVDKLRALYSQYGLGIYVDPTDVRF